MRDVRSYDDPAGSTCSTTPLASRGEERLASWALDTMWAGSMIVTAPAADDLEHLAVVLLVITAQVSSSTPIPSSWGDWATIISSRP